MTDSNETSTVTKLFDDAGTAGKPDDQVVTVLKNVAIYPDKNFAKDIERITKELAADCMKITQNGGDTSIEFDRDKFVEDIKQALAAEGFNMNVGNPDAIVSVESKGQANKLLAPCAAKMDAPEPAA